MQTNFPELKKTARQAGLLYLLLAVTGAYTMMYVRGKTSSVKPVEAIQAVLDNETLYRTGILSHLVSVTLFLFLSITLYKLLKSVDKHQARLMVALVVVQVPFIFILEGFKLAALMIAKGQIFTSLSIEQSTDLFALMTKLHSSGIQLVQIFWGLWLIPFGRLVYYSHFIPKILGVLLIIAGIGYTLDSIVYITLPGYREFTRMPALILSALSEISTIFWLLIVGVKESKTFKRSEQKEETSALQQ